MLQPSFDFTITLETCKEVVQREDKEDLTDSLEIKTCATCTEKCQSRQDFFSELALRTPDWSIY